MTHPTSSFDPLAAARAAILTDPDPVIRCSDCGALRYRDELTERAEEIYLGRYGTVLVCAEGC